MTMSKSELCKARYLSLVEKNKEAIRQEKKKKKKVLPFKWEYVDGQFVMTKR